MSDFYFALARITAAQICRACGIERCSRGVLEVLTDVLIKYLMLLGSASATALELRNASDASAADALLAASQYDAIRSPGLGGVDDIIDLISWLKGPIQQRLVRVARPQKQGASLLGAAQGAALAALPSSTAAAAAAENGKGTSENPPSTSTSTATMQPAPPASGAASAPGPVGATIASDPPNDWLKAVLNQQVLMGHRNKFQNTPLGTRASIDPTIWGEPQQESADH